MGLPMCAPYVAAHPSLWDIVLLAARMSAEDWSQLRQLIATMQGGWWAYAPARLVERYRPGAIPADLLCDWRAQAPPLVRARAEGWGITDVSLCNLRRLSLGNRLQWARSPVQALDYLWQKSSRRRTRRATSRRGCNSPRAAGVPT